MKYSLTRLLLEDKQAIQVNMSVLPSAEDARKIGLINTYRWVTKLKDYALKKMGMGMDLIYRYGDPKVKRIIEQARDTAKRKDREMQAILTDDALFNYVWGVFSGSDEDEKKKLARCLGYQSDVIGTPKTGPTGGQTDPQFEAEIKQGCEEIKTAAAISIIEDLRIIISQDNTKLRLAVKDSLITQVAQELETQGVEFELDLADDPEIRPILDAQEDAEEDLDDELNREGRALIFKNNADVSFAISAGGIAKMCARRGGVVYERRIPLAAMLLEGMHPLDLMTELSDDDTVGADDDESPEPAGEPEEVEEVEGEEEGAALDDKAPLQPPPADLQDAIGQIISRYKRSRKIEDTFRRVYSEMTTDALVLVAKSGNPIKNMRFRFPSEDGNNLGSPAQIATQGSISIERAAAGVIFSFLKGARTKDVQPEVLRMVADLIDPAVQFSRDGKLTREPDTIRVLSALKDNTRGLQANADMQNAFIYAVCAVDEYASKRTPTELGRMGPTSLSSYGEAWKQNLLSLYVMSQNHPEMGIKTRIRVTPGAKIDPWYKKFIKAARHSGTAREKFEWLKNELSTIPITSMQAYPRVEFEEDPLLSPQIKGSKKKTDRSKRATGAAKFLLKELTNLTTRSLSSKRALTVPNRTPGDKGGNMNIMSMCNTLARSINRSRKSGVGRLLLEMGYSSGKALILRTNPVSGRDVFDSFAALSGVSADPYVLSRPFNIDNFTSWSRVLVGKTGVRIASVFNIVIAREIVNPVVRSIRHAIDVYAERGDITKGEGATYDQLIQLLARTNAVLIAKIENNPISIAQASGRDTRAGISGLVSGITQLPSVTLEDLPDMPSEYDTLPARGSAPEQVLAGDGGVVTAISAAEGAPLDVDIAVIGLAPEIASEGVAEGGGGGSERAEAGSDEAEETATPPRPSATPPGPGPAPAPPPPGPAPRPAPAPTPPDEPEEREIDTDFDIERSVIPDDETEEQSVIVRVDAVVGDGTAALVKRGVLVRGRVVGGTSQQTAASEDPRTLRITVEEVVVAGEDIGHEIKDRVDVLDEETTIGDIVSAARDALSGESISKINVRVGRGR